MIEKNNVRIWGSDIEEGTILQAEKVARLPILAGPVVLVADAHVGIGASVGTVITTDGAIVPSTVGVDLGCFSGTTKISLLDGTQETLYNLTKRKKAFWVYSLDEDLKIVPGLAWAIKTRKNSSLVKLTISGGDEIVCTPDHEFMLKNGTYREAQYLKFNDSLMPLYRRWTARDGYETINNGDKTRYTHKMVYTYINGEVDDGFVIHHKNSNHLDNQPENLMVLTPSEHSSLHRKLRPGFMNDSPEFQEKRRQGMKRAWEDSPEYRELKRRVGTTNITDYMLNQPDEFKKSIADNGKRGAKYLIKYNTSPIGCEVCGEILPNPGVLRRHKKQLHNNHKVLKLEFLSTVEDVYCLQVEKHHNFALAAGVFVHNCGIMVAKSNLTANQLPDDLQPLHDQFSRSIPAGVGQNRNVQSLGKTDQRILQMGQKWLGDNPHILDDKLQKNVLSQLGTLGSGNHFVEVVLDETDRVWVMLHSGSRGVGNQLAQKHIEIARKQNLPIEDRDLSWLTEGTPTFDAYISDMLWCQGYAYENRKLMMVAATEDLFNFVGHGKVIQTSQCHHNFAVYELHNDEGVWVTRKGAIRAEDGDWGVIPGSMATGSYIVEGLGNPLSYNSAPHGAGRRLSRGKAKREFTVDSLKELMGNRAWNKNSPQALLDEHPLAYKDVKSVIEDSSDLVRPIHTLRSILNYKGV